MRPMSTPSKSSDDAAKAIRFLAIKAAIFILGPLLAAVIAALTMLK